jgi:hypothetical protein
MPCERAEQPLSHSALEDTSVPTLMEIMMAGSPEDICLFTCSPQSLGTRGGPGAALSWEGGLSCGDTWGPQSCPEPTAGVRATGTHGSPGATPSQEWEPEPRGHVAAPELPRAGSGSLSRGDTWWPRSCPQPGGVSRCLGLKLVRGGTRSSRYRQWRGS